MRVHNRKGPCESDPRRSSDCTGVLQRGDSVNDEIADQLGEFVRGKEFCSGAVVINVPLIPMDSVNVAVARNRGYFAYPPTTQLFLSAVFRELAIPSCVLDIN